MPAAGDPLSDVSPYVARDLTSLSTDSEFDANAPVHICVFTLLYFFFFFVSVFCFGVIGVLLCVVYIVVIGFYMLYCVVVLFCALFSIRFFFVVVVVHLFHHNLVFACSVRICFSRVCF